ncbi:MAG TPA: GatB/YqeY domain-containing protein [Candidatus Limnocylindrales bacterium]|nr:GatB/YqeY domain-containing protein [Candidatus Limnocylindrales bacterium]
MADLKQRLESDLRTATKARDVTRRETLRLALSAIHNEEVARRGELDDDAVLGIVQKQAKMRRESIEAFGKGGRSELVAQETAELGILESYLPSQLGREEIRDLARQAIAESGATGVREQGKVMQRLMPAVRGRADGKMVAEVVSALLQGTD